MHEDKDILRELWEGKLPICFSMALEDVYTVDQPDPFYLLVPRQSYLPLATDKVYRHFVKSINSELQEEMWLDYEGTPLKWHYPIGVLFDMLAYGAKLPWSITVHFHNFPADELLHCGNKEVVESHFMSVVKEADALKHRSAVINNMQKKDHKQLWNGLLNDKFEQFWSINRKLMDSSGDFTFRHIPFRVYQKDCFIIQKLFKPVSDTGEQNTLQHLLQEHCVDIVTTDEKCPHRFIIQGIEVPLNTPLLWLSVHFSHPDNFLHITIVDNVDL